MAAQETRSVIAPKAVHDHAVADQPGYRPYFDEIIQRLRPGGLALLDDVWSGNVVDESDHSGSTVALRAINDHIAADGCVEAVMLPLAGGLTLERKE